MKKVTGLACFLILFQLQLRATGDTVNLLFVGDVMQHLPQVNAAFEEGNYNYEPCFRYVKNEIEAAGLALANLETPLGGKPYSGYPRFSAPDQIASALKETGFDVLLTANNHSCDRNGKGIGRTIKMLDSFGIKHTGMFANADERAERYPLMVEKNGFRIAILNYTYGTNGIPVDKPYVVNLIDTGTMVKDLETAKLAAPDLIIAYLHWGTEYARKPNENQKELADFLYCKGVHLIIGSHPHVIQHIEKRYQANGRCRGVIAYSLGNFVSNQSNTNTDGGAVLRVSIVKDSTGTFVAEAEYALVWVYKPVENRKRKYFILPAAEYENNSSFMDLTHQKKLKTFIDSSRKLLNEENIGVKEFRFN
ncbi:MAG: CapA family protein [Prevotellaceae bacterium]|nr:CapA family protein [Prevotellaceae bacterium]